MQHDVLKRISSVLNGQMWLRLLDYVGFYYWILLMFVFAFVGCRRSRLSSKADVQMVNNLKNCRIKGSQHRLQCACVPVVN